jgi:hypothetical protein
VTGVIDHVHYELISPEGLGACLGALTQRLTAQT